MTPEEAMAAVHSPSFVRVDGLKQTKSQEFLISFNNLLAKREQSPEWQHEYLGPIEKEMFPMATTAGAMMCQHHGPPAQWFNACIHALL